MTDHAQSGSNAVTILSARIGANSGRLAPASIAALTVITLGGALIEESRLPDAQKCDLFGVLAQAYP